MAALEEPLYYLNNFHVFIDWVESRYRKLMLPNEKGFLDEFRKLPESAQAILVRLIMRKGKVFRASKIKYGEIKNCDKALAGLVSAGFLNLNAELTAVQVGQLLLKPELSKLFGLSASLNKTDMLSQLESSYKESKTWSDWFPASKESLYELDCHLVVKVFKLMFFGNLHQNLTEFVTSHLGVVKYEVVAFSDSDRAFTCRKDIDDYLLLDQCSELMDEQLWQEALQELEVIDTDNFLIVRKQDKLRYRLAYHFERTEEFELARMLYQQCVSTESRIREIRVLMSVADYQGAWDLWQVLYAESMDVGVHQTLHRIARRLSPKVGGKQPVNHQDIAEVTLNLPKPVEPIKIELVAKQYLETPDTPVFYVENSLFTAMLGLWCWDVIFSPVKGAFFNPFQLGPVDLTHPDFVQKRSRQFKPLWLLFESDRYIHHIRHCYQQKHGLQNPLINWSVISENVLDTALKCISGEQLKSIFSYMLTNLKDRRGGIPDLIQFDTRNNIFELIEVKGPGDRLQQNQSLWFEFFGRQNINSKLCYIRWLE